MINEKFIPPLIFTFSLVFLFSLIDKPHEVWDERSRYLSGLAYWYNIVNGNFDSGSWEINYQHPPVGKYIYGIANGVYLFSKNPNLNSLSVEEAATFADINRTVFPGRLIAIVLSSLSLVFIYLIGKELFNKRIGIFAVLLLILLPPFLAHSKVANLEAPLLLFNVITLYFLFKALKSKKQKYYILFGIFAGLAISTKFNNLILFLTLPLIYIFYNYYQHPKQRYKIPINFVKQIIIPFLLSAFIFFISWPWLWSNPFQNLYISLVWWNNPVEEYFLGKLTTPPPYYYLVYFFVTVPAILLLFLLYAFMKIKDSNLFVKSFVLIFLLYLFFFSLTKSKQNGISQIFPIFPIFTILTAIGIDSFYSETLRKRPTFTKIFFFIVFSYLILLIYLYYPNYHDYYNELTFGPSRVFNEKLFEIGWQGEGIDEAVNYINQVAPPNSTVEFHVLPAHTLHLLRSDLKELNPISAGKSFRLSNLTIDFNKLYGADFLVENTYFRWYVNESFNTFLVENLSYKLLKTIDVQGAPLAWIYKRG